MFIRNRHCAFVLTSFLLPMVLSSQDSFAMGKTLPHQKDEKKKLSPQAQIEELINKSVKSLQNGEMGLVATKVNLVGNANHIELFPEYTNGGIRLRINYDEKALQNPKEIIKTLAVASVISRPQSANMFKIPLEYSLADLNSQNKDLRLLAREIKNVDSVAEILLNARSGDAKAIARWNHLESLIMKFVDVSSGVKSEMGLSKTVFTDLAEELVKKQKTLNEAAAKQEQKKSELLNAWVKNNGSDKKIAEIQQKLTDLSSSNNREGVAKLLEASLPWVAMTKVEMNSWKLFIESIRNPNNNDKVVVFKGLFEADKELHKNGKDASMKSLVMNDAYKNLLQRWTSAKGQYGDSFVGTQLESLGIKTNLMTEQIDRSARNTRVSTFISFRNDPMLAFNEMGIDILTRQNGKMVGDAGVGYLVAEIDARRLTPEFETMKLLAPLVVFPDEIVRHKQGAFESYQALHDFLKQLSDEKGQKFEAKDSLKNYYWDQLVNQGMKQQKEMIGFKYIKALSCSKVFN